MLLNQRAIHSKRVREKKEREYTLNKDNRGTMTTETFDKRAVQIKKGTIVNLKAANVGVIEIAGAASDFPVGMVSIGNRVADERVTVKTPFVAVVACIADGGVEYGELVTSSNHPSKRIYDMNKIDDVSGYEEELKK